MPRDPTLPVRIVSSVWIVGLFHTLFRPLRLGWSGCFELYYVVLNSISLNHGVVRGNRVENKFSRFSQ